MNNYLANVASQQREKLATLRYAAPGLRNLMMCSLGLSSNSWCILEIKHERLISHLRNSGDVDILAGNLQFDTNNNRWLPITSHLVGIETKCAVNTNPNSGEVSSDDIEGAHTSPREREHINKQIDKLLMMGFNRVGFFDFVANPLQDNTTDYYWNISTSIAIASLDALLQKDMHTNSDKPPDSLIPRLPNVSPVGHWVISTGSVVGGDERLRGQQLTKLIQEAAENPLLQSQKTQENRKAMENSLRLIFQDLPTSVFRSLPIIIVACSKCNEFHSYDGYERGYFCPQMNAVIG